MTRVLTHCEHDAGPGGGARRPRERARPQRPHRAGDRVLLAATVPSTGSTARRTTDDPRDGARSGAWAPRRRHLLAAAPRRDRRSRAAVAPARYGYGAVYFPWIRVRRPAHRQARRRSAVGARGRGLGAHRRAAAGVHKAPANETVRGALDLRTALTPAEHGLLNSTGINAIRSIGGSIRIWGARTLAGSSSEWRYLPCGGCSPSPRSRSSRAPGWVVFEPNDQLLWNAIRRDIGAFLRRLWRDGALMGATEREAFFVKCDAETNPQENIDAGIVTALVGHGAGQARRVRRLQGQPVRSRRAGGEDGR